MSLHDELLIQTCCIHCHSLARKQILIMCSKCMKELSSAQHKRSWGNNWMFQISSNNEHAQLEKLNSAVSRGKCVLIRVKIIQMSKFKLESVEKIHHQLQVIREEPESLLLRSRCPRKFPFPPKKIAPGQIFDEIHPPPSKKSDFLFKTWNAM